MKPSHFEGSRAIEVTESRDRDSYTQTKSRPAHGHEHERGQIMIDGGIRSEGMYNQYVRGSTGTTYIIQGKV